MALVDYASSDEGSGDESVTEEVKKVVDTKENPSKLSVDINKVSDNINGDNNGELFTSLPKPRKTFSFLEDDSNKLSKLLLNKNSLTSVGKESVKISVPSVSEFDDSQGPAPKKLKPSVKGTGLFSVLPPPKNATVKQTNRNFVPHVLSKNQVKQNLNQSQISNKVTNVSVKSTDFDEDDDDDPAVASSFFGCSLVEKNSKSEPEHLSSESTSVEENPSSYAQPGSSFINETPVSDQNSNTGLVYEDSNYYQSAGPTQATETVTANDNPLDLDEKALQILCGNKKKRHNMPMNVIELSGEEVLPDSKEWLLKQFTEERGRGGRGLSHRKTGGPSSQSRRKHQITYLAYQAKEQELELKNQWAQNRMSRKQTQSKYGF